MARSRRLVFAAILAIGGGLWASVEWRDWVRFGADLKTYDGASINDTKTQVMYSLGIPETVQGPLIDEGDGWQYSSALRVSPLDTDSKELAEYEAIAANKSALDFDEWHYWRDGHRITVEFDPKSAQVSSVTCWQIDELKSRCPKLFGITSEDPEAKILERLGRPDKVELAGGGTIKGMPVVVTKVLEYETLGLQLTLSEKKVGSIVKLAAPPADFSDWIARGMP